MEMKLKAQKDFGREVKTEIETGNGNAKSPKVTQGIVESISGSLNTINDIGEFIKTYGSAFPGTLNIAGASQGLASTESSRLMEKIILDYGYSKSGKALTKTEAEAVRRVIKGGHLTGKSSTYGGVKIILSDVIGRLEGYKKQGLLKPEDEKALANARGLLGELEAKSK